MSISASRPTSRAAPVAERSARPLEKLARLGRFLTTHGSTLDWRELLAFALFAALVVAGVYWQVLLGGRTLSLGTTWKGVLPTGPYGDPAAIVHVQISDPLGFYIREPWRLLAAHLWTHGQLPLWDPNLGGGTPLDPFSQSDAFFLPEMLFTALPAPWWDVYALLRLVLCGVFAYLFLRALKLSPLAAATGAFAYMLSGSLTWVVSTDMLDGFMLTPLLLWSIERLVTSRGHRLRWSVVVTLLMWQLLLSGFAESIILALVLASLYYFVRALHERLRAAGPAIVSWREGLRTALVALPTIVLRYMLITLAAAALAAPALLLFLEVTRTSGGTRASVVRVTGSPALHYDFRLFFPYFDGSRLAQWNELQPSGNYAQNFFGYSGLVTGLLAAVAVLGMLVALLRRRPALPQWVPAVFFTAVAAITLARINNLPVVGFISDLPILRTIKFYRYAGGIWAICLAVLAAIGTDLLLARRGWLRLASIGSFLALLGALLVPNLGELQADLRGMDVAQQQAALAVATTSLLAGGIVLGGVVLALALGAYIPRAAQVAMFALLLVELVADVPTTLPLRYNAYTPPPYLAFVQRSDQPVRTYGLDSIAFPNVEDGLGLQDAREYNALPVNTYVELLDRGYDPHVYDGGGWTGLTDAPPNNTLTAAQIAVQHRWVLDLLNVRYVLTNQTDLGATHTLIRAIYPPFDLTTLPLPPGSFLSQAFTAPAANLSAILLSFTGHIAPADASGTVTLALHAGGANAATVLRTVTLPLSQVQATGVTRFAFDPLPDPAGQPYLLVVTAQGLSPATHLALWAVTTSPGHPVGGASSGTAPLPNSALTLAVESGTPSASDYRLVYNQDVRVYENPDALPRAFVARQVETGISDDRALAQLADSTFAPASTLLLADSPPAAEVAAANAVLPSTGAVPSTVRVTSYQADGVTLQANMAQAGFVALQDTYYPGWNATVDGTQTPIYRSDIMFRAVFVPAGQHTIQFTYLPDTFIIGLWLVPLPPVLLLVWLALAWVRRRVRPGWRMRPAAVPSDFSVTDRAADMLAVERRSPARPPGQSVRH